MSHLDSWSIIAGHLAEVPARIAKRVCDKSIPIALSQGRIVFVVPSKLVGRPHLTLSQRKRELVTHPLRPMRGTRGGASQEPSAGAAAGRRSAGVGHSLTFPGTRRGESSLGSGGRAVFVAVLSRVWNRRFRRSLTKGQEIRGGPSFVETIHIIQDGLQGKTNQGWTQTRSAGWSHSVSKGHPAQFCLCPLVAGVIACSRY